MEDHWEPHWLRQTMMKSEGILKHCRVSLTGLHEQKVKCVQGSACFCSCRLQSSLSPEGCRLTVTEADTFVISLIILHLDTHLAFPQFETVFHFHKRTSWKSSQVTNPVTSKSASYGLSLNVPDPWESDVWTDVWLLRTDKLVWKLWAVKKSRYSLNRYH